jgi:hypothetical protein
MKLLALITGYMAGFGLLAAAFSLAIQDPRGHALIFGVGSLLMGVTGLWTARTLWRSHRASERRLYLFAGTVVLMVASLLTAFPYTLAGRSDVWPVAGIGVALFASLIAMAGRYARRHHTPMVQRSLELNSRR